MSEWPPAAVPPEPDELRSGPTRRRLLPTGIAVVAVLALAAAGWSVLIVRRGQTTSVAPSPVAPSPVVTTSAGPTPTSPPVPSTGPVRLVAATGDTITVPVTAGWLPAGANRPVITNDGTDGLGSVTWWLSTGIDQIWLQFVTPDFRGGLTAAMLLNTVPGHPTQTTPLDVNGHPATQVASTESVGAQCRIGWQQQPELAVIIYSIRSGTPSDQGCGDVARMARSVAPTAWTLAPAVRLGLVPAGYPRVTSADRMQAWCRAEAKAVISNACVWLETSGGAEPPSAGSTTATVHGRRATITRDRSMTAISVAGAFRISLPNAQDDPSLSQLTDADLVRIAESATVPGH
jgi:hypothetical protein